MLNIKNPRAHELAVKVAAAHGETLTDAVIHSLEERLARRRKPRLVLSADDIAGPLDEIARAMPPSFFSEADPTAFLYEDDEGETRP